MRVLLTAAPGTGHVVPLLGIGQALRDAGHHVQLEHHPSGHDPAREAGLDSVASGISEAEMGAERPRRWPDTEQQPPARWAVRMFTQILAPAMVRDLAPIIRHWRPDLIIHEEGEYAGPVAAATAGIPWLTHGWGSPLRSAAELASLETDAAPLWDQAGLEMPAAAGLYRYGLLNPCPAFLQSEAPGAQTVWPIRPATLRGPQLEHVAAPASGPHRPVAYVGFGTVAHFADAPDEIRAAVTALVRHGLDALVTTHDDLLSRELVEAYPGRVQVRRFVSLRDLLPRCDVAICHGGAGTVLAALAAAVPLVLMPRGSPSQLRMADACTRAGVGRVATVTNLDHTLSSLLADKDLSHRCADAAADLAAMPPPADLVPALEGLLH